MNDRARAALAAMRLNAETAIRYAADHPDWRRDQLVTDAIAKRVEEVAEAAKLRFPRSLRIEFPDIEWDEIAGMRDRLAHDYGNVDLDVLEEVVVEHLPKLLEATAKILARQGRGAEGS